MDIQITVGNVILDAQLNDTPAAGKVAAALPLGLPFNTWGDEIYFEIPVVAELDESAREEVVLGNLGYGPLDGPSASFSGRPP